MVLLMTISSMLFLFYGLKVLCLVHKSNKFVLKSAQSIKQQSSYKSAKYAEYKLIFIVAVLCLFFIIQSLLTIYFIFNNNNLNIYWRFIDIFTHFICLFAMCIVT